jgi:hypothetical protein
VGPSSPRLLSPKDDIDLLYLPARPGSPPIAALDEVVRALKEGPMLNRTF